MRGSSNDLTDSFGERRLGKLCCWFARPANSGEFNYRVGTKFEVGTSGRNCDVFVVMLKRHRAWFEATDDVGGESCGNDTCSVINTDDFLGHLDSEIQIRTGDRKHISGARQEKARQHRRRCCSCTNRSSSGSQHLNECIALGSELHEVLSFRGFPQSLLKEEDVHEGSRGNKSCGLWTTYLDPWWTAALLSPLGCGQLTTTLGPSGCVAFGWGRPGALSPGKQGSVHTL